MRLIHRIALLSLIGATIIPMCTAVAVTNVGAGGGGWLYASVFHRSNPGEMMIGTDMNGVFRTTDWGDHWDPYSTGLYATTLGEKSGTYVQGLCQVDYGSFNGYYAATVAGIYSRDSSGPWVDETPVSSWYQTWYNYNEYRCSHEYHDTHIYQPISFSSLAWAESTAVLVAGCGVNRWTSYNGANVFDWSGGWSGYPGCDAPSPQTGVACGSSGTPAYNSYLVPDSSSFQVQYTVFRKDLDNPTGDWTPLNGLTVNCEFGAARAVAAAKIGETVYVAATTTRGVYLYDFASQEWTSLQNKSLYVAGDTIPAPWCNGHDGSLAPWSVQLTRRGTLYVAMERPDSLETVTPSGVYCIRDVTNLANACWEWVANEQDILYGNGGNPECAGLTMREAGLLNIIWSGVRHGPRTHFIFLGVGEGAGEDPDILYLGDRNSSCFGMLRAEVDPAEPLNEVQWTSLVYRTGSTYYNVNSAGVAQTMDPGWANIWAPNVISEPGVDPNDPENVLVQFNPGLFLTQDSYSFEHHYCLHAGNGWITSGYTETMVNDIGYYSDGRLQESNGDVGLIRSLDSSMSSFERLALPGITTNATFAIDILPNGGGPGTDAVAACSGPRVYYQAGGSWTAITPDSLAVVDVAFVESDVCFAAGHLASNGKRGVWRGDESGGSWSWTLVYNRAGMGMPQNLLYVPGTDRLYLSTWADSGRYGGVYYLENPSTATNWTQVIDQTCESNCSYLAYKDNQLYIACRYPAKLLYCTNVDGSPDDFTFTPVALPSSWPASVQLSSIVPTVWDSKNVYVSVHSGVGSGGEAISGVYSVLPLRETWDTVSLGDWQGIGALCLAFNPLANHKGQLAVGTIGYETLLTSVADDPYATFEIASSSVKMTLQPQDEKMYWVFEWDTTTNTTAGQDKVHITQESCDCGGELELTPASGGVTHSIEQVGSVWHHTLTWEDGCCVPNCTFDYHVSSGNDYHQHDSGSYTKKLKICPSSGAPGEEDAEVQVVTALRPPAPNPGNPAIKIAFTLAQGAAAELSIYDARGRKVVTLAREAQPGPHEVTWYGRDENGRAVSSGIYFVRMSAEGKVFSGRIALVR